MTSKVKQASPTKFVEPVARTDLTEIPNPSVDHVEIFTFTN